MVAIFFGRLRREEFSLPTGSWHRPVGNETTVCDQSALKVDCGQLVPVRQRDDQLTMKLPECTRRQDHAGVRRARERPDRALDLARIVHVNYF
jgi:hypothetical protein